MQQRTVALRERGRLAALFHTLWQAARQQRGWRDPDRRNTRTWQTLLLAVVVARTNFRVSNSCGRGRPRFFISSAATSSVPPQSAQSFTES